MIKYESNLDQGFILNKAQSYFKNNQYWSYVYYVHNKIELFSPTDKSHILYMLGVIYTSWKSYDKAIFAFKTAIVLNDKNSLAHRELAKLYMFLDYKDEFRDAFYLYSRVSKLTMDDNYLINYYNEECTDDSESRKLVLVDNKYKFKKIKSHAQFLLAEGNIDEAMELYEQLAMEQPTNKELLEKLTLYYLGYYDEEKLLKICLHRMNSFADDVEALAIYLQVKSNDSTFDDFNLYNKMLGMEITNIESLKSVCNVVEWKADYKKCLEIIDQFAVKNDYQNNYDVMVMKTMTYLKMGDKSSASKMIGKINISYGIYGLGSILPYFLKADINDLKISAVNYIPNSMWYMAKQLLLEIEVKVKIGEKVSNEQFWQAFEMLFLTADEDDVINFLITYKNQFTLKNHSKIAIIIHFRALSNIMKAGILYALLVCGIREIDLPYAGINKKAVFEPIEGIEEYPQCYNDAYMYAFAYCCIYTEDFNAHLITSAKELLEVMKNTKRKFQDVYALAGAIICNAYVLISNSMIEEVARVVECSPKKLKSYIDIIKRQGSFFEYEADDMFEMLLKRMSGEFAEFDFDNE